MTPDNYKGKFRGIALHAVVPYAAVFAGFRLN
jgi:hypothetical protein